MQLYYHKHIMEYNNSMDLLHHTNTSKKIFNNESPILTLKSVSSAYVECINLAAHDN